MKTQQADLWDCNFSADFSCDLEQVNKDFIFDPNPRRGRIIDRNYSKVMSRYLMALIASAALMFPYVLLFAESQLETDLAELFSPLTPKHR